MQGVKKISFLLPSPPSVPVGGYKVVYEYANRMAADGYDVDIVYPCYIRDFRRGPLGNLFIFLKAIVKFILFFLNLKSCRTNWFRLDQRIGERAVLSLWEWCVPRSDIYIATAVKTAMCLDRYSCGANNKVYLVQHFENWEGVSDEMVTDTYRYGMKCAAISKWLYDIVSIYNSSCVHIPNGFDFDFFCTYIHPSERNRFNVAMMYHKDAWKGCEDAFAALAIVKERYPQLGVKIFGVAEEPEGLPDWYTYFQTPDRDTFNMIYNESAVFIGASLSEGWGLTIGEAMICSCAVACTDNDGYREMAINGTTALLSSVKKPEELAKNIISLIGDDNLRIKLASNGNGYIKSFTWEESYRKLKELILKG